MFDGLSVENPVSPSACAHRRIVFMINNKRVRVVLHLMYCRRQRNVARERHFAANKGKCRALTGTSCGRNRPRWGIPSWRRVSVDSDRRLLRGDETRRRRKRNASRPRPARPRGCSSSSVHGRMSPGPRANIAPHPERPRSRRLTAGGARTSGNEGAEGSVGPSGLPVRPRLAG